MYVMVRIAQPRSIGGCQLLRARDRRSHPTAAGGHRLLVVTPDARKRGCDQLSARLESEPWAHGLRGTAKSFWKRARQSSLVPGNKDTPLFIDHRDIDLSRQALRVSHGRDSGNRRKQKRKRNYGTIHRSWPGYHRLAVSATRWEPRL